MFHTPPGSPAWNIPFALRIEGPLDRERLEHGLRAIVQRHRVLEAPAPVRLAMADVEELLETAEDPDQELLRLRTEEACVPFDYPRAPLFRFKLLRLAGEEHVLLLTFHHAIFEGRWSLSVLMRELTELYENRTLPDLPLHYSDYAAWQRETYRGDALEAALARWRERFRDVPRYLELPADRERPPVRTFRGASIDFALERSLIRSLKNVGRKHGATLFMTLLGGFGALLARESGQSKVAIGTAMATRQRPGTRELIGNFVNFLPLVLDTSGNPTFTALVARARDAMLEASADPELPFEHLANALDPSAEPSRAPLCQVFFAWHGPTPPAQRFAGMTMNLLPSGTLTPTCRYDLHIHLAEERENEVTAEVEYATDLFEPGTITGLLERYRRLLESAVAIPDPGGP